MSRMADFGNDLYTGRRSIDFVGKSKTWYIASAVIMAVAALGFVVQGLNLSLEFTGGSEFQIAGVADTEHEIKAVCVVHNETSTGSVSPIADVRRVLTESSPQSSRQG